MMTPIVTLRRLCFVVVVVAAISTGSGVAEVGEEIAPVPAPAVIVCVQLVVP